MKVKSKVFFRSKADPNYGMLCYRLLDGSLVAIDTGKPWSPDISPVMRWELEEEIPFIEEVRLNITTKLWYSFLHMSPLETTAGTFLGVLLAYVIGTMGLGLDINTQLWEVIALDTFIVCFCIGVIAWARIQPPPDIDNRPESKREP